MTIRSESQRMSIRSSSDIAMKQNHAIWIDSICISQHDDDEKTAQVKMMGDIYQRATRVVVWLGNSGERKTSYGPGEETSRLQWRLLIHSCRGKQFLTLARHLERGGAPAH